ncbi:Uncharacterised protein [Campylobacter geochelonis]|uniref:Uncharacterized protein n=1 Tax=Campylobacter geochelonis TaxID=1780362 RepID=A0A128EML1_9BACT|nr:Uncharacterised protein [Campylobacter geochelonis]
MIFTVFFRFIGTPDILAEADVVAGRLVYYKEYIKFKQHNYCDLTLEMGDGSGA